LFAVSPELLAQQLRIADASSGKPIDHVYIFNSTKRTTTLSDRYGLADLSIFKKNDTLTFQHAAYVDTSVSFAVIVSTGVLLMDPKVVVMPVFELSVARENGESNRPFSSLDLTYLETRKAEPRTTADLLRSTGMVAVQQSQLGGGSPNIRGFEANRILLVLDGVRMNNAIYRSGHLQNIITVDNEILGSTDVVFGPASVLYGSDALGGVISMKTKEPKLAASGENVFSTAALLRYGSAANERTAHVDLTMANDRSSSLTSITYSAFGHLKMGKVRPHGYRDWGKVFNYVETDGDGDHMVSNGDPNKQVYTGYEQLDVLQKFLVRINEHWKTEMNLQLSTSSNIARFDRLTQYNGDTLKYAQWDYGPQDRVMIASRTEWTGKSKLLDKAMIIVAAQNIHEQRLTRRFSNEIKTDQEENVAVFSLNMDLLKSIGEKGAIYYGAEITNNIVRSEAKYENIANGERTPAQTRYPDGGSTLSSAGIYVNYRRKLNDKLGIDLGTRYSRVAAKSTFEDTSFVKMPFTEVKINNGAPNFSAALSYRPAQLWETNFIVSSGFRSPNVDDYGKVFEKDGYIVVPNDQIAPEFAYNAEVGITKRAHKERTKIHGAVFYTVLKDAIVRRDFSINGQDSLEYDGETFVIQANTNASQAVYYGFALDMKAGIAEQWTLFGTFNYTHGSDVTDDVPMSHIQPIFGLAGIEHGHKNFSSRLYANYSGWKYLKEMAPGSVDNPSQGTVDGFPSWYTLNFSTTYTLTDNFRAQIGLENILDHHYMSFASGMSAPGRNLVISLRANI